MPDRSVYAARYSKSDRGTAACRAAPPHHPLNRHRHRNTSRARYATCIAACCKRTTRTVSLRWLRLTARQRRVLAADHTLLLLSVAVLTPARLAVQSNHAMHPRNHANTRRLTIVLWRWGSVPLRSQTAR